MSFRKPRMSDDDPDDKIGTESMVSKRAELLGFLLPLLPLAIIAYGIWDVFA